MSQKRLGRRATEAKRHLLKYRPKIGSATPGAGEAGRLD